MNLTMRPAELRWREDDYNRRSNTINSIHLRGHAWPKQRFFTSHFVGSFESKPPDKLHDLLTETRHMIHQELMERNIIPKEWPNGLLPDEEDGDDSVDAESVWRHYYSEDDFEFLGDKTQQRRPFDFKIDETVLVNPEFRMSYNVETDPRQSYVSMYASSRALGRTDLATVELVLSRTHLKKVFDVIEEVY